jgi:hypothetical protein
LSRFVIILLLISLICTVCGCTNAKYYIWAYPGDGPGDPIVEILPNHPFVTDDLLCSASNSTISNGKIGYNYRWYQNGVYQKQLEGLNWVDSSFIRKGDIWVCSAILYDGSRYGNWSSATVIIQDSFPGTPKVRLYPDAPTVNGTLTCCVDIPSIDNDGDLVYYNYMWYKNGGDLPFRTLTTIQMQDSVDPSGLVLGDVIGCNVTVTSSPENVESRFFSVSQDVQVGPSVRGDINGDGKVDETDIKTLQSIVYSSE